MYQGDKLLQKEITAALLSLCPWEVLIITLADFGGCIVLN
jgi:hypothetical protein